jgi:hypothetical protein
MLCNSLREKKKKIKKKKEKNANNRNLDPFGAPPLDSSLNLGAAQPRKKRVASLSLSLSLSLSHPTKERSSLRSAPRNASSTPRFSLSHFPPGVALSIDVAAAGLRRRFSKLRRPA